MKSWNTNTGQRPAIKDNTARQQDFNGIRLVSKPRKGWHGHWTTLNSRVVIQRRLQRDKWQIKLDGKRVGTNERILSDAVSFNEWIVSQGAKC